MNRSSPGTLARDLLENGGNGRKIELDVRRRVDIEGAELDEYMRTEGEKNSAIKLIKRDVEEPSSDSDDDIEMNVITGKHDIVVRPQGRASTGFFKSSKKQYAMFPFHEEKVRHDDYGEIIQLEDYKLADVGFDAPVHDDNKENGLIKSENNNEEGKSVDNGNSTTIFVLSELLLHKFDTKQLIIFTISFLCGRFFFARKAHQMC